MTNRGFALGQFSFMMRLEEFLSGAHWQLRGRCPAPRRPVNWSWATSSFVGHVTPVVAAAVPGRSEIGAAMLALATWSRGDATSSLVAGSPDPVGESTLF